MAELTPGMIMTRTYEGSKPYVYVDSEGFFTSGTGHLLSAEERAKRRQSQLKRQGLEVNMRTLLQELEERDRKDIEREHSPLIPAEDSVIIDTNNLVQNYEVIKIYPSSINIKIIICFNVSSMYTLRYDVRV